MVYPEVILLDTSGLLQVWYGNSLNSPLHKVSVTAFWVKPKSYIRDKENKRHSSLISINDYDTDTFVHSVWKKWLSKIFSLSLCAKSLDRHLNPSWLVSRVKIPHVVLQGLESSVNLWQVSTRVNRCVWVNKIHLAYIYTLLVTDAYT